MSALCHKQTYALDQKTLGRFILRLLTAAQSHNMAARPVDSRHSAWGDGKLGRLFRRKRLGLLQDLRHQLRRNDPQRRFIHHLRRALVLSERVVERDFLVRETRLLAAPPLRHSGLDEPRTTNIGSSQWPGVAENCTGGARR